MTFSGSERRGDRKYKEISNQLQSEGAVLSTAPRLGELNKRAGWRRIMYNSIASSRGGMVKHYA